MLKSAQDENQNAAYRLYELTLIGFWSDSILADALTRPIFSQLNRYGCLRSNNVRSSFGVTTVAKCALPITRR